MAKKKTMADICREIFKAKGTGESAVKLAIKKMNSNGYKADKAQRAAANVIRLEFSSDSKKKSSAKKKITAKEAVTKSAKIKTSKKVASSKKKQIKEKSKKSSNKKIKDDDLDDF